MNSQVTVDAKAWRKQAARAADALTTEQSICAARWIALSAILERGYHRPMWTLDEWIDLAGALLDDDQPDDTLAEIIDNAIAGAARA